MTYTFIQMEKTGYLATLTLNRPEVLNALQGEMILELIDALEALGRDREVRVLVLQGAGGNFCSGADVNLFSEDRSPAEWLEGMGNFNRVIRMLREIPQPVVTKLRGVAVGGGANLALTGDFVIAAHNARFRENFVHLGVILDGGGTYFLPRLVGLAKARELAFLGNEMDGRTAADIGLIYRSVPEEDLDREVGTLANALGQKSLTALTLIKHGLDQSLEKSLVDNLQWEAAHQAICLTSPDHKLRVQWFLKARGK